MWSLTSFMSMPLWTKVITTVELWRSSWNCMLPERCMLGAERIGKLLSMSEEVLLVCSRRLRRSLILMKASICSTLSKLDKACSSLDELSVKLYLLKSSKLRRIKASQASSQLSTKHMQRKSEQSKRRRDDSILSWDRHMPMLTSDRIWMLTRTTSWTKWWNFLLLPKITSDTSSILRCTMQV